MKVHYLEIDNTLTIFGVVSKKRTGFDGTNVVGVCAYDLETGEQVKYQTIPEHGIVSVDEARHLWCWWIEYAHTFNHKIKKQESSYNSPKGYTIMMDGQIVKAMEEIALNLIHRNTRRAYNE